MHIPSTWSPSWTRGLPASLAERCDRLAWSGPYRQYARSPHRIHRTLHHLRIPHPRRQVLDRLQAWFLFMGVSDDAIDHGSLEDGAKLLHQLRGPLVEVHEHTSFPVLITEVFRHQLDDACRADVLRTLEEVFRAVSDERNAQTEEDFLPARRRVGWHCSTLNHALIAPLLGPHSIDLYRMFGDIGVVGVFVDSLVDYPRDRWRGELRFPLTKRLYSRTAWGAVSTGVRLTLRNPSLIRVFGSAVADVIADPLRR